MTIGFGEVDSVPPEDIEVEYNLVLEFVAKNNRDNDFVAVQGIDMLDENLIYYFPRSTCQQDAKMLAASITTQPWDRRKSFNSLNKRFKQVLGAVGAAAIRAGALWRNHAQ